MGALQPQIQAASSAVIIPTIPGEQLKSLMHMSSPLSIVEKDTERSELRPKVGIASSTMLTTPRVATIHGPALNVLFYLYLVFVLVLG